MNHFEKYLKYKNKYIELKSSLYNLEGGGKKLKKSNSVNKNYKYNKRIKPMDLEPNYIETVSEPWFTLISLGLKTVEGRRNKGRFREMKVGDIVQWENNDFAPRSVNTIITRKAEYSTFKEYLETEGLDKCLPGIPNIEIGLSVYFKYFTKEDEKEYGVVAIEIKLVK